MLGTLGKERSRTWPLNDEKCSPLGRLILLSFRKDGERQLGMEVALSKHPRKKMPMEVR